MTTKVAKLNELIREGYEVLDITSDDERIEARLVHRRRGEAVVRFTRLDAYRILYDESATVAVATRRGSRYLVTGALR